MISPEFRLNTQNEQKVKKLGDEIRTMKVAKVKLIKQMKDDSEKVSQVISLVMCVVIAIYIL